MQHLRTARSDCDWNTAGRAVEGRYSAAIEAGSRRNRYSQESPVWHWALSTSESRMTRSPRCASCWVIRRWLSAGRWWCYQSCAIRDKRANPVLVYLGRISYGLYVFHVLGLLISDYTCARPDGEPISLPAASLGGPGRNYRDGGDLVSLAGNAVPGSQAAIYPRAVSSGRVEQLRDDAGTTGRVPPAEAGSVRLMC